MSNYDFGRLNVAARRTKNYYLPNALSLRERVDRGVLLGEYDIQLIQSVLDELNQMIPVFDRHPKYQKIAGGIIALYTDIVLKAAGNENKYM